MILNELFSSEEEICYSNVTIAALYLESTCRLHFKLHYRFSASLTPYYCAATECSTDHHSRVGTLPMKIS